MRNSIARSPLEEQCVPVHHGTVILEIEDGAAPPWRQSIRYREVRQTDDGLGAQRNQKECLGQRSNKKKHTSIMPAHHPAQCIEPFLHRHTAHATEVQADFKDCTSDKRISTPSPSLEHHKSQRRSGYKAWGSRRENTSQHDSSGSQETMC